MNKGSKPAQLSTNFSQALLIDLLAFGITKDKLALKMDVTIATINNILEGKVKQPNYKTFSSLLSLYCAVKPGGTISV